MGTPDAASPLENMRIHLQVSGGFSGTGWTVETDQASSALLLQETLQ